MNAVVLPEMRPGLDMRLSPLRSSRLFRSHRPAKAPWYALVLCFAGVILPALNSFAQAELDDEASEESYIELWDRGAYEAALEQLEGRIKAREDSYIPGKWSLDYAELLFANGRVDAAIGVLEALESRRWELPQGVRLAEMYLYRGRLDDYLGLMLRLGERAEWAMRYADEEDWVALARLNELEGQSPSEILGTHLKILTERRPSYAPGFVMVGDLAYRHRGYDVAAQNYEKALSLEPQNQAALAGLAECYWQSGDPRLEDALNRLFELNPNHPRGIAIRVEELLDLNKAGEALDIISTRLALNENDLHFKSLKAAAHFMRDEIEEMEATQAAALQFNPHWSEVYRIPGRVAARHYRFEEAAALQEKAIEVDPQDYEAHHELAFNLLRLGEEEAGVEHLELAYEGDKFNVHTVNMLEVMDSIAGFETIEQGAFRIQMPAAEARVMTDDMFDLLNDALVKYENKYDVRVQRPVVIQVFDDHDEFMVRSVGLPGNRGHLGICFGRLLTMDSPRARPPDATNWESVLWHEFVHVITLQKTNNRMPRWLSEGISVYEETARSKAWGQKLEPGFKKFATEEGWPTASGLQRYFTQPKSGEHLIYGYFLAGEFIAYYVEAYGDEALSKALSAIADGADTVVALSEAAEIDEAKLNEGFAAHLDERCASLQNLPDAVADDEVDDSHPAQPWIAIPSPFTDALRAGMEAASAGDVATAEAKFLEAHELFPEFEGGMAPLNQLADVYKQHGDQEKYVATLERIVAREANPAGELRQLIDYYRERDAWEKVAQYSDALFAINPFDVTARNAWLKALKETGDYEAAAEGLAMLAYLDAQHRTDHRLERARLLARAGESELAKRETLELLEAMPHFWEAQSLLLELRDGAGDAQP